MSRLPALRAGSDFRRAYSEGRKARRDGVTVFVAGSSRPQTRAGIVVPRRVGGAVERNRMKRRIRAILGGIELSERTDLIVNVGPSARGLRFQDLENHVLGALADAGGLR